MLDLMFVCLDIHNKHKCVVVLNLLHGGLCCQGELDDGIVIQPRGESTELDGYFQGHTSVIIVFRNSEIGCISS